LAVSWIYLLDAAILIAVIVFLVKREESWSDPLRWFMVWLGLNAVTNVLMFLSRAVPDSTVSQSFWLAAYCMATVLVVAGLFFVRSFEGGNDFQAIFWTVPACFSVSYILVAGGSVSIYEDGVWRFDLTERTVMVPLMVLFFYAVCSLVYLVKLYLDIRREGNVVARRGVAFILWAFAVIFVTNMASPFVRHYVSPLIPVGEIGSTLGALIIALDLSWVRARREKKQALI
jgi:hypothetical protein